MLAKITTAGAAIAILVASQVSSFAGDLNYNGLAAGATHAGHHNPVKTQRRASLIKKASFTKKKSSPGTFVAARAKQPAAEPIPVPDGQIIVDDLGVHLPSHNPSHNLDPLIIPEGHAAHGECGSGNCCHTTRGQHRTRFFAEYLYLRSRDSEVVYAEDSNGPVAPNPAIQVSPVGMVDPDFQPGFRVGFAKCLDAESSIEMKFARFESSTSSSISRTGSNTLSALVQHPAVNNAAGTWIDAGASLDVDFDLVDLDYRWIRHSGENYVVNMLMGARYGRLEQNFRADFSGNGTRSVVTDIDFAGGGLRIGADFERYARCRGWMLYGRSEASVMAGEFSADYFQGSSVDAVEVDTHWKAGRIVPMLDLEAGVGWQNKCGSLRFTLGYMFSAWFNTVQTDEWITAVHSSQFQDLSSATTFDGLTLRGEYRF